MGQATSPGEYLQTQFIFPPNRTPARLAEQMGVPVSTIEGVIRNRVVIDEPLAAKLAAALGTSAQVWLDLQRAQNLPHASVDSPAALAPNAHAPAGSHLAWSFRIARGVLGLFMGLTFLLLLYAWYASIGKQGESGLWRMLPAGLALLALATSVQLWIELQRELGPSHSPKIDSPLLLVIGRVALLSFMMLTLFPLLLDVAAFQARDIGYEQLGFFVINLPIGLGMVPVGLFSVLTGPSRKMSWVLLIIAVGMTTLGPALLWLGHLRGYKESGC